MVGLKNARQDNTWDKVYCLKAGNTTGSMGKAQPVLLNVSAYADISLEKLCMGAWCLPGLHAFCVAKRVSELGRKPAS